MALRQVVYIEDEMLRKTSRPVTKFDARLHTLLDDMLETMRSLQGVGLAAPQVAVLRRAVVMDCGTGVIEMMNPEILETSGEQEGVEGCLSVPGRHGLVTRPMKVKVRYQDRNGEWRELEAEGLLARCIMHETDHLDGQLYVDIMTREVFDDELEPDPDEAAEEEKTEEDTKENTENNTKVNTEDNIKKNTQDNTEKAAEKPAEKKAEKTEKETKK